MSLKVSLFLYIHIGLSLLAAVKGSAVHNLPIYLFGLVAYANKEQNTDLLKTFNVLLMASVPIDIIFFICTNGSNFINAFVITMASLSLVLKPLTIYQTSLELRSGISLGGGILSDREPIYERAPDSPGRTSVGSPPPKKNFENV